MWHATRRGGGVGVVHRCEQMDPNHPLMLRHHALPAPAGPLCRRLRSIRVPREQKIVWARRSQVSPGCTRPPGYMHPCQSLSPLRPPLQPEPRRCHKRRSALLCQLSSWFNFYCLPRTYANSLEATLSLAAVYHWGLHLPRRSRSRSVGHARTGQPHLWRRAGPEVPGGSHPH